MTSDEIKKFLTTDPRVLQAVDARYEEGDEVREFARTASKWKRRTKYAVGSDADGNYYDAIENGRLKGGVVRVFELSGSDGAAVAVVEKNGKVVYVDDLSD